MSDFLSRRRLLTTAAAGAIALPLAATLPAGLAHAAGPKIYLDPGHGGAHPGAVSGGMREKDITLDVGLRTRAFLRQHWTVDVRMSRTTDVTVELTDRARDANTWGANVFVSIHCNAGGGTGYESYIYPGAGSMTHWLQDAVHAYTIGKMREMHSIVDRGQKAADFAVLRQTAMPAVLTENLFVDTASDRQKLADPYFRQKIAEGHAVGIAVCLGLYRP